MNLKLHKNQRLGKKAKQNQGFEEIKRNPLQILKSLEPFKSNFAIPFSTITKYAWATIRSFFDGRVEPEHHTNTKNQCP